MPRVTRLVGRAAELAGLEHERRLAIAGQFRVVLLLADPGIGKTQLAREFLARNRRRTIGLSARAFPLGASASFGVWSEAFEHHREADGMPCRAPAKHGGPMGGR